MHMNLQNELEINTFPADLRPTHPVLQVTGAPPLDLSVRHGWIWPGRLPSAGHDTLSSPSAHYGTASGLGTCWCDTARQCSLETEWVEWVSFFAKHPANNNEYFAAWKHNEDVLRNSFFTTFPIQSGTLLMRHNLENYVTLVSTN